MIKNKQAEFPKDQPCRWCHKPIEDGQAVYVNKFKHLALKSHLACEEQALSRHRGYYYFFVVLAVSFVPLVVGCVLSELITKHKIDWDFFSTFAPIMFSAFSLTAMVRSHNESWEQRIRQVKAGLGTE